MTRNINFYDPGYEGRLGIAEIVDTNTGRVDNSNIGRRLLYSEKVDMDQTSFTFDIYAEHDRKNFKLPLDVNGMVIGFKKLSTMTQLPLYDHVRIDPNNIEKFTLDLSNTTGDIDIECTVARFDYYIDNSKYNTIINNILTENNNDLSQKVLGFTDSVGDCDFDSFDITSTPKMVISRGSNHIDFSYCGKLTTIAENLLRYMPNITHFYRGFYRCKSLTSIPAGLFDNNIKITNFDYCFYECTSLTSIPAGLFDNNINVDTLMYCFQYCYALASIPAGLFDKNVKITEFYGCFRNCTAITSIPAGLFDNNINAAWFTECFGGCKSLTSIPEKLFDNNVNVTEFRNCFDGCTSLVSIPAGLFDKNVEVTDFDSCFKGCTSLTSIPAGLFSKNTKATRFSDCFCNCASLTSIPVELFDNNINISNLTYCFGYCTSLTTIPAGLFDSCTKVTSFESCFYECSSLVSIPAGLFDKNVEVTTFEDCFWNCSSLASIPAGLFDKNVKATDFSDCFKYCSSLVSIMPDIWNKDKFPNVKYHGSYASECYGATNYYICPDNYGGPYYLGSTSFPQEKLVELAIETVSKSSITIKCNILFPSRYYYPNQIALGNDILAASDFRLVVNNVDYQQYIKSFTHSSGASEGYLAIAPFDGLTPDTEYTITLSWRGSSESITTTTSSGGSGSVHSEGTSSGKSLKSGISVRDTVIENETNDDTE